MTQEEKAKAYDEVLEQAKRELNTCGSLDCDAARQIFRFFPQLRESNDERIRKYLIEELKATKSVGELKFIIPHPTREECIAYLEKQKEQKHPDGCFTCDEYKKGYEEGRRNGFTAGYNKAIKEVEQKEQKPVEWSEEDEKHIDICIKALKEWEMQDSEDFSTTISFLKSLRPSWKPSEWQMSMLLAVINDPNNAGSESCYLTLKSIYEQLKKL